MTTTFVHFSIELLPKTLYKVLAFDGERLNKVKQQAQTRVRKGAHLTPKKRLLKILSAFFYKTVGTYCTETNNSRAHKKVQSQAGHSTYIFSAVSCPEE